jgi:hypothetical protein
MAEHDMTSSFGWKARRRHPPAMHGSQSVTVQCSEDEIQAIAGASVADEAGAN